MKFLILLLTVSFAQSASAGEKANGGDICESRIISIREDIRSWLLKGGANDLGLPQGLTLKKYSESMHRAIKTSVISCTDERIYIEGAEKTCKNFVDSRSNNKILCNREQFMSTDASDQYVLIHHEFAGIAGLEVNEGAESDYEISQQISSYLENQVVKKLAVNPKRKSNLRNCREGYICPGDAVVSHDGWTGTVLGINSYNRTASVRWSLNNRGAYTSLRSVSAINLLAIGLGCVSGYCVGDTVMSHDGWTGTIIGVNPYNESAGVRWSLTNRGAYTSLRSVPRIHSLSTSSYCETYGPQYRISRENIYTKSRVQSMVSIPGFNFEFRIEVED